MIDPPRAEGLLESRVVPDDTVYMGSLGQCNVRITADHDYCGFGGIG